MKQMLLLSYTSLYSIVWDNENPLLCNRKQTMDGYSLYQFGLLYRNCKFTRIIISFRYTCVRKAHPAAKANNDLVHASRSVTQLLCASQSSEYHYIKVQQPRKGILNHTKLLNF
ncbi:Hypothetical_protein [Hexamita inflata]|uniref:Hypothetical_protein n=1 Tax=Hexamita inflata TaxID=28002 RepID=A0AA86RIE4_9EUKA|nr:Hypothetical protein HINF_LOCUS60339 [Hexamita inflata]